jgi:hypothetical protein
MRVEPSNNTSQNSTSTSTSTSTKLMSTRTSVLNSHTGENFLAVLEGMCGRTSSSSYSYRSETHSPYCSPYGNNMGSRQSSGESQYGSDAGGHRGPLGLASK